MPYYKITANSVAVYDSNSIHANNVGYLKKNAIIECQPSLTDWHKIKSLKTKDTNYYTGVIDGMYVMVLVLLMEEVDGASVEAANNPTPTDNIDTSNVNYIDDAFAEVYSSNISSDAYLSNLNDGLRVSTLNGIMGMPHQFLPNTDPKIDETTEIDSFGRIYAEKIVAPMPLMFMTPGVPSFMTSFSEKQKSSMLEKIIGIDGNDLDNLTNESSGKYYSLKYSYIEYFNYVNAMLRSAAFFLGIESEEINGRCLSELNWFYSPYNDDPTTDIFDNNGLRSFLGTYAGAIPFYVEAETRISDNFSNQTTQSTLASLTDTLSDKARELNFLIGSAAGGSGAGDLYEDLLSVGTDSIENVSSTISGILGQNNILSNILNGAKTLISGGKMMFPELWSDSTFSRSYSVTLKLVSPSGDKLSIFLNILVPIYHLLGFVLPRQSTGSKQSYFSPFLIRAYYKGLFNIDMGIITDMDITKGSDGEWTPEGLPTVAEVSFTIKDLYDGLFMSTAGHGKDISIMSNITELDYIANSCGINIDEPDIGRTVKMYLTLGFKDRITDKFTLDIFGGVSQYFNQKIQNIFGHF